MKKEIKEFIEELDVLSVNLCEPGKEKYAKCQRDRIIETFKEALKSEKEKLLGKIGLKRIDICLDVITNKEHKIEAKAIRNGYNQAITDLEKLKREIK